MIDFTLNRYRTFYTISFFLKKAPCSLNHASISLSESLRVMRPLETKSLKLVPSFCAFDFAHSKRGAAIVTFVLTRSEIFSYVDETVLISFVRIFPPFIRTKILFCGTSPPDLSIQDFISSMANRSRASGFGSVSLRGMSLSKA